MPVSAAQNCPPPTLMLARSVNALQENALFAKWRPKAYIIAPNSWINDPMTMFVTRKDNGELLYHVSYQYYHAHTQWGPPSQASCVSSDGVHWRDIGASPLNPTVLAPDAANGGPLAIFDGTVVPGVTYRGGIAQIFTAVNHLPIGWTLPFVPMSEVQSLAWTTDEGQSWNMFEGNPVIASPPREIPDATGFRDPFLFHSTHIDTLTGVPGDYNVSSNPGVVFTDSRAIYMAVSGGNRETGSPALMLYRNTPGSITIWEDLGVVFMPTGGVTATPWTTNIGHNFECANLVHLDVDGDASDAAGEGISFVFGGAQDKEAFGHNFWAAGRLQVKDGQLGFIPSTYGCSDWGDSYAPMSFIDRSTGRGTRRLMFSWAVETNMTGGWKQRGWNGSLTSMKELFVKTVEGVVPHLADVGHWMGVDGTYATLGTRFAAELVEAFTAGEPIFTGTNIANGCSFANRTGTFSLDVLATPNGSEYTRIMYNIHAEELRIDRTKSSTIPELVGLDICAKHRLWTLTNGEIEPLRLSIVVDASLVEIIANDVTVMTVRAYPTSDLATQVRISAERNSEVELNIYEGLVNAWPDREVNTSVPLVQEVTGGRWAGF